MATAKDTEKKIEALRDQIRHHEYRYFVLDDPEISDANFDQVMNQLKKLEAEHPALITPDSPTQRVGGKPREGVVKAAHSSPMLSLDNTYNVDDLRNWERRVHELSGRKDIDYVCELSWTACRWRCSMKMGDWCVALHAAMAPSAKMSR